MKRVTFVIALLIGGLFFTVLVSFSGQPHRPDNPPAAGIPDSVMAVFQKACTGCHADGGNSIARGKLNFSKWESYDTEKQAKKAGNICQEMKSGSMPPKKWKAKNPGEVPTAAEVEMVCRWADGLKK